MDDLVRDYLARGGKVTICPPGSALPGLTKIARSLSPHLPQPTRRRKNPWWVRSDWTLVKVKANRIASAEVWLRERQAKFYTNLTKVRGNWHVRVEDRDMAMLFKLTWGGA